MDGHTVKRQFHRREAKNAEFFGLMPQRRPNFYRKYIRPFAKVLKT
jgi:hypothetical protein